MIKYTLVGCGRIAKNHIQAAIACPDVQIAALCDLEAEKTHSLAARFGLEHVNHYTDCRQMFEQEHPDLVAVATDSGSHFVVAMEAASHGCHVIVEKPVTLSLADADALAAVAQRQGVQIAVCHQNRFNPSVQRLRRAVEQGDLGRLLYGAATIRWNRGQEYYDQAPWRGKWATDGGALMNQCIHDIDLLRWMLGTPQEVWAVTERMNHRIEAEDFGAALVRFAGGSVGVIEGTTNVYPSNLEETLCLFGTQGTVKLGGTSLNLLEQWRVAGSSEDAAGLGEDCNQFPPDVYGFGHMPLYTDMLSAIKNGHTPYIPLSEGRAALELVLAIYGAAAAGKSVALPLGDCATLKFTGRFG